MEFGDRVMGVQQRPLAADALEILQVNLGYACNMSCKHCHVGAAAGRTQAMDLDTIEEVLGVLRGHDLLTLDITGGAPELNSHFGYLVRKARELGRHVIVRTNLTIFFEQGMQDLAHFYRDHAVEVVASLPYYSENDVDRVRGKGTFQKSIAAIRKLNHFGYGDDSSPHRLNLVYNPPGAFLAPPQKRLEEDYKRELKKRFNISFGRLYTFANMPIGRFRDYLIRCNAFARYMETLMNAFNPETLAGLMCRHLISVGWDGRLYDCDFNQMLGLRLANDCPQHIADFDLSRLAGRAITVGEHCYGCSAGQGST